MNEDSASGAGDGAAFAIVAAALVLFGAVLRFGALDSGLPNPRSRPDELSVVHEMARPARGQFALERRIYPDAYVYLSWLWVEAGLRVAPLLGAEPTGGYARTLHRAPERIFLLARTLSATAGAATVALAIVMARRRWGAHAALAAGLLVATCFLHARESHAAKPDALLSLTTLLALAACVPLAEHATRLRAALAGAAVGLAMASKYPGLLMTVPLYAAAVMGSEGRGLRRAVPGAAVLGGLCALIVFAATSPLFVFSDDLASRTAWILHTVFPQIFSAPGGALTSPADVEFAYPAPPGVDVPVYGASAWYESFLHHVRFTLWYGVGALATLLAPFALLWGFAARRPLPLLAAVTVATWTLVVGLSPAAMARYLLPALPVLLLLEAGLLAEAARRFAPRHAGALLAVACVLLALQPALATLSHNRIAGRTDTRVEATRWLADHASEGDRMAVLGTTLMAYGRPVPPAGVILVEPDPRPDAYTDAGVDWVLTHDHTLLHSTLDPAALEALDGHLRLRAEFDPRGEGFERAVFEAGDAYYIPVHGFGGVLRPGPHIRVYSFAP